MNITPELLAQAIALLQQGGSLPRATVSVDKKAKILSDKDKRLLATFHRRGFKDVVLMDRANPDKPFNVRPFGSMKDGKATGWLSQGRVVRKGEKSVQGLFHISQTEPVTQAPAKPKEGSKFAIPAKPVEEPKATGVFAGVDPAAIAAAVAKLKAQQANTAKPQPAA